MEERIFGTESEYALCYYSKDKKGMIVLEGEELLEHQKALTGFLLSCLKDKECFLAGEFLGNGGRFYIDRGGHPEYATPECRSVRDVVIYEKAGDRMVQDFVATARSLMGREDRSARLHLFKNNVDFFGNTYGGHENYLITPRAMEHIETIVPFLVTRQIFAGAGKVTVKADSGSPPYQLTQRADFIDRVYSDRTSQVRGIINTRKREIPRYGQNRRLHLIFADSNMCEYALALKIGTTGIVLRLLEEGSLEDIPMLVAPVQTMKRISCDLDSVFTLEGRKGSYTAHDVQCMYLEKARQFFSSREASGEEKEILDLWAQTLAGLDRLRMSKTAGTLEEDPNDLKRKLDWVLKLWLLNRCRKKCSLDRHDPRLKLMDLKYHDLDPETGLFEKCRALDLVDRFVDEEQIRRAQMEPPTNTRARIRGMIIQNTMGKNIDVFIENWEGIILRATQKNPRSEHFFDRHRRMVNTLGIKLEDPFKAHDSSVQEDIMRFIETWG